jgi:hypothetical protein
MGVAAQIGLGAVVHDQELESGIVWPGCCKGLDTGFIVPVNHDSAEDGVDVHVGRIGFLQVI